jgi:hypothetical protein
VENLDLRRHKLNVTVQIRYTDGLHFVLPKRGKVRTPDLMETSIRALSEHIKTYGTTAVTLPWDHRDDPLKTASFAATTSTIRRGTGRCARAS